MKRLCFFSLWFGDVRELISSAAIRKLKTDQFGTGPFQLFHWIIDKLHLEMHNGVLLPLLGLLMENPLREYSLGSINKDHKYLQILDVNPAGENISRHYPIQPYCPSSGTFQVTLPSRKFKDIVAYYFQTHVHKNALNRFIYPTGNIGLVFRCSHHAPGAFLVGTPTSPREAEYVFFGYNYFCVLFWPGMGLTFCGLPASELTDRSLPLHEMLPGESESVTEKIVLAKTIEERICVFERFLDQRLSEAPAIPGQLLHIIEMICNNKNNVMDYKFSKSYIRYSERHIRRLFHQYVGISPKLFENIMRHQKILRSLNDKPRQDMADLALEHGFCDQPHFIRNFKRFQGITPIQFMKDNMRSCNPPQ